MIRSELEDALSELRRILADAITTATYNGEVSPNGQAAKNAAIRSSTPIQKVHQVVQRSIYDELISLGLTADIWPPIGRTSPELKVSGLLKSKDQDVAVTVDPHVREVLSSGVMAGTIDPVGFHATNRALVVGVRSQLSSVEKNFDTLAERAFAETLNLRLRCPDITLGEVYLLPLNEFDDAALKTNRVGFKRNKINLLKFAKFFNAITESSIGANPAEIYEYNATALIVADFSSPQVRILWTPEEVEAEFDKITADAVSPILPSQFTKRISEHYDNKINPSSAKD